MSHLSDRAIASYLLDGSLVIDPILTPLQPASVDLRLGPVIHHLVPGLFDPRKQDTPTMTEDIVETLMLGPGQFALAATYEWIEIPPGLVGIVTGKSTLARVGLQVEAAGYVDPGWKGHLTLELTNLGPLMLVLAVGMPICQIRFDFLTESPEHLYGDPALGSHYQESVGPVGARFSVPSSRAESAANSESSPGPSAPVRGSSITK